MNKPTFSEKWQLRFIGLAYEVAKWSSDATGVGAIIVGSEKNIISTGYNGAPKGVQELPLRKNAENKKYFIEHSERNAIYLAKSSLDGAILFTTHYPCADCARAIIQSGIKEVYFCEKMEKEHWIASMKASEMMLSEAKIQVHQVKFIQPSLFVVVEHSAMKNSSSSILTTNECTLKTIAELSQEPLKVQIRWEGNGEKPEGLRAKTIRRNGTT